jgi:hypothetical protein
MYIADPPKGDQADSEMGNPILNGSSSSSAFALAWRNYSPSGRSITPPRFYERFFACHYG